MKNNNFKSLVVRETDPGNYVRTIETRKTDDLPQGDVLIRVHYSSLNYKDALSASGNKGVTRNYPHTPGIDAAGIIEESSAQDLNIGDEVIVTGYDLGMNTSGGFAQYIRVPADWVVKKPSNMTLRESMIYGTAGFTAALSIYKLLRHGVRPEDGSILVTGATGGVGSTAIKILNKLGYSVSAVSGKSTDSFLTSIGVKQVLSREEMDDKSGRLLLKPRWSGAVDTVGGNILSTIIKETKYDGIVTCCGNVASPELVTTVYPFILRGVSLVGIDSVQCPMPLRKQLWDKLADEWNVPNINEFIEECKLEELTEKIDLILKGQIKGRIIVNLN
jgi:acrylyl-CoA reductase (NADPH)